MRLKHINLICHRIIYFILILFVCLYRKQYGFIEPEKENYHNEIVPIESSYLLYEVQVENLWNKKR